MSFKSIIVGDYGQIAKITFIDVDTNAAADISAYNATQQMIFTAPDGRVTVKEADFDSDGSDGIVKYTIEAGLLDKPGPWEVRARVQNGAAKLTTEIHKFFVGA